MPETTIVVRVDGKLKTAFAEAAKAADRTTSQLVRDFMRDYVDERAGRSEYDAWHRRKVEAGREAAREGRVKAGDEVELHFAARRAKTRRKLARNRK